jgi:hypothetical protein
MDRIACAWLIKNFIDLEAEFIFAPNDGALEHAQREGAIPFVVPHAEFSRQGERITMDVLLDQYNLHDPALRKLADIMRAADIRTLRGTFPESEGVRALVHGFFLLNRPDAETLALALPAFDALYRYCQEVVRKEN